MKINSALGLCELRAHRLLPAPCPLLWARGGWQRAGSHRAADSPRGTQHTHSTLLGPQGSLSPRAAGLRGRGAPPRLCWLLVPRCRGLWCCCAREAQGTAALPAQSHPGHPSPSLHRGISCEFADTICATSYRNDFFYRPAAGLGWPCARSSPMSCPAALGTGPKSDEGTQSGV